MFQNAIQVAIFIAVGTFFWSVSNSLEQMAKDLRIIAGRYGSKPPAEDPEQLIDA